MRARNPGFTLVELLLALSLAAVLLLLATRACGALFVRVQVGAARSELAADLASAVRRSLGGASRLVLCPSQDGESCDDASDWGDGWVSFTEPDGERHRTAASRTVSRHGPLDDSVRLRTSDGRRAVVFQSGGTSIGSNLTFTFCDQRSNRALEKLVLSNAGRLRRDEGTGPADDAACAQAPETR